MNREIKFRAFFERDKKMFNNIGWHPSIMEFHPERKDGEGEITICPYSNGYTIMQYTGLKDKDGKEIYEGDIISVDVLVSTEQDEIIGKAPKEDYVLGVVEFHKGAFMAVMCGDNGEKAGCEIEEDCIILGNKFEHPDLLK